MSGATLTLDIGDNTHSAVATNTNLDGSTATGVTVTFTSDNPAICAVDVDTGVLTPVSGGTTNINEKSTRLAFLHTDSGSVTVNDPNVGDFTSALTFN